MIMDAIRKIKVIQKKIPIAMAAPSSTFFSSVFDMGTGGINAKIRNEKNTATINSGNQAIPQPTGPKGVIQSCPAHVARKMIRKNTHKPLMGLLENKEKIRRTNKVTRNAAGMIE
jgi:hypothetical protein